MNTPPRILLLAVAFAGSAVAGLPKKTPVRTYQDLWTNSPFTSPAPPPPPIKPTNILENYALGGVSPIGSGYRVTLLNKKNPEERIIVDTDRPREGFKVLTVIRKPGDPLGTLVSMAVGSMTGTVGFDEKLLTLAVVNPPASNQLASRQSRPRVITPPLPLDAQGQTTQSMKRPGPPTGR